MNQLDTIRHIMKEVAPNEIKHGFNGKWFGGIVDINLPKNQEVTSELNNKFTELIRCELANIYMDMQHMPMGTKLDLGRNVCGLYGLQTSLVNAGFGINAITQVMDMAEITNSINEQTNLDKVYFYALKTVDYTDATTGIYVLRVRDILENYMKGEREVLKTLDTLPF